MHGLEPMSIVDTESKTLKAIVGQCCRSWTVHDVL